MDDAARLSAVIGGRWRLGKDMSPVYGWNGVYRGIGRRSLHLMGGTVKLTRFSTTALALFATILGLLVTWPSHLGQLDRDTSFQWLMLLEEQGFLVYPHHPVIIELLYAYNSLLPTGPGIHWIILPYLAAYVATVIIFFRLALSQNLNNGMAALLVATIALNPAFLFQLNTIDDNLLSWPLLAGSLLILFRGHEKSAKGAFLSALLAGLACAIGTASMGWAIAIGVALLAKSRGQFQYCWPAIVLGALSSLVPLVAKDLLLGVPPLTSITSMFISPSDAYFGNFALEADNLEKGLRMTAAGILTSAGPLFIDPLTMVSGFSFPLRRNPSILLLILILSFGFYSIRKQAKREGRIFFAVILLVPYLFHNAYMIFSADDALQERTDWIGPWLFLSVLGLVGNAVSIQPERKSLRFAKGVTTALIAFGTINLATMIYNREAYAEPEWRFSEMRNKTLIIRSGSFRQQSGPLEYGRVLSVRKQANACYIYAAPIPPADTTVQTRTLPWLAFEGSQPPSIPEVPEKCERMDLKQLMSTRDESSTRVLPEIDEILFSSYTPSFPRTCKGLTSYLRECNARALLRERHRIPAATISRIEEKCEQQKTLTNCMSENHLDCSGSLRCINDLFANTRTAGENP